MELMFVLMKIIAGLGALGILCILFLLISAIYQLFEEGLEAALTLIAVLSLSYAIGSYLIK